MAELNASNEVVWAYVNGAGMDQPIERIAFITGTARNRQVYHADGLGSVAALTDEGGEPVQTYAYAAFGGVRAQTGTDLNRVTFTAREAMGDSLGFFYYRNRIYDPNTGRFTSEDPLGFRDGPNRYIYCANNPLNLIDPLGLTEVWAKLRAEGDVNSYFHVPSSGQPEGKFLPVVAFGGGTAVVALMEHGVGLAVGEVISHGSLEVGHHFLGKETKPGDPDFTPSIFQCLKP